MDNNRTLNIKFFIIATIFLIVYLFFATPFFLHGKSSVELLKNNTFNEKDKVYYYVDSINSVNNIYEDVEIILWAFCETKNTNAEKKITLIFEGQKNIYSYEIKLKDLGNVVTSREDVYDQYKDKLDIFNVFNGCVAQFSTSRMEDGQYKLYIYCEENSNNYGIAETNDIYVKENDRFYKFQNDESEAKEINLKKESIQDEPNIKFYVDSIQQNNKTIDINGWAIKEGLDSEKSEILLLFKDSSGKTIFFNTTRNLRADVSEALNSTKYDQSGFLGKSISLKKLKEGNISMYVLIKENQKIVKSQIPFEFMLE